MIAEEILRNPEKLEEVERTAFRLVEQAIRDYLLQAVVIFREEQDKVDDIAEDVTREAMDSLGMATIQTRLFGKVDYKRAGYVFMPEQTAEVALLVDSKAEKGDDHTATIQTSQTSMQIRMMTTKGDVVREDGKLPKLMESKGRKLLTVTIIVKYAYRSDVSEQEGESPARRLEHVTLMCLPNGALQDRYNPSAETAAADSFWRVGRHASSRGEEFRVRININALAASAGWRVVRIQAPNEISAA